MKPFIIGLIFMVSTVWAQPRSTQVDYSHIVKSQVEEHADTEPESVRSLWPMLTDVEWERYQLLKKGPMALQNERMDPLWLLGMMTDDDEELRRYAELSAQMEFDRTDRTTRFVRAYSEAASRLFGDVPLLIDGGRALRQSMNQSMDSLNEHIQSGDRVLLFVDLQKPSEGRIAEKTIDALAQWPVWVGLDIHFLNANDEQIIDWAKQRHIDRDWVTSRRITLNHDDGRLDQLGAGNTPQAFRLRENTYQSITSLLN